MKNKKQPSDKTEENNIIIKILKIIQNTVGKIFWVGNVTHDNLEKCLAALNLDSTNSGWYNPVAIKINGLTGYYMVNQDGSIYWSARVIKQDEKKYLIEHLTTEGVNKFEELYSQFIDDPSDKTSQLNELIDKIVAKWNVDKQTVIDNIEKNYKGESKEHDKSEIDGKIVAAQHIEELGLSYYPELDKMEEKLKEENKEKITDEQLNDFWDKGVLNAAITKANELNYDDFHSWYIERFILNKKNKEVNEKLLSAIGLTPETDTLTIYKKLKETEKPFIDYKELEGKVEKATSISINSNEINENELQEEDFVKSHILFVTPNNKETEQSTFEKEGSQEGKGKLYEFFTPQIIADKMVSLAYHYGFNGGKVLEPAAGNGRLIKDLSENDITAFEINPENAEMLKKQFPNAQIYNFNFERAFLKEPRFNDLLDRKGQKTWLDKYPFDLVIANPPYGKFSGIYSSYFKFKGQFEHFFILQSLYLLRSGGLGVYLIPSSFLRNGITYTPIKKQIFEIATLTDAYRMPSNIFKDTQIGTDILVLTKK